MGTPLLPHPQYVHQKVPIEKSRASALGSFQITPRPSSWPTWKCFVLRPLHQEPRSLAIELWFRYPRLELDREIGCVGWMRETLRIFNILGWLILEIFRGTSFPSTWRNSPETNFQVGFFGPFVWRPTCKDHRYAQGLWRLDAQQFWSGPKVGSTTLKIWVMVDNGWYWWIIIPFLGDFQSLPTSYMARTSGLTKKSRGFSGAFWIKSFLQSNDTQWCWTLVTKKDLEFSEVFKSPVWSFCFNVVHQIQSQLNSEGKKVLV